MKSLFITAILQLLIYPVIGQTDDATAKGLTEELHAVYERGHIVGFSVAIVNQDGRLYEKGFGYADRQQNIEYTENTIQTIASISKTFIGLALLKAQELGKLNLDDPVNKYLNFEVKNPYFPNHEITIRQLANHTSSIKDASSYERYGYVLINEDNKGAKVNRNFRSPGEMMAQRIFLKNILSADGEWYTKRGFLKEKPGEEFEYSNIGAGLAALVLENATGESFSKFTKDHILSPLDMSDSGWNLKEVDTSLHSKFYANQEKEIASYQLVNYPDGGLITSSSSLGKYLSELVAAYGGQGKILNDLSYKDFFRPHLTAANYSERKESKYNDEYNMGIFMGMSSQGQIGHTGGDPGVATFMFFNKETNIGKVMLVNTDLEEEGVQEFLDVWKILEEYENKF